jgi:uncharacterized membrane protein
MSGVISLFQSRKFWAALFGVVVVVLNQYGKFFDPEQAVGLTIIVVSFVMGIAINPQYAVSKWKELLGSRQFWAALVGLVVLFADAFGVKLPLSPENFVEIMLVVGSFIVANALQQHNVVAS